MLIRARFLVDAVGYDRVRGKPFRIAELVNEANRVLKSSDRWLAGASPRSSESESQQEAQGADQ